MGGISCVHISDIFLCCCLLVPFDVAGVAAAFVPFESIGKFAGNGTEGEVERSIGSEHHVTRHFKAMEIARK